MVFCFVPKFCFGQHKSQNIYSFLSRKARNFFRNITLCYMTKTLNQIIFFFLHQNQNIFFSNIGNQNIFLEKTQNPPFKLKGPSLSYYYIAYSVHYVICCIIVYSVLSDMDCMLYVICPHVTQFLSECCHKLYLLQ